MDDVEGEDERYAKCSNNNYANMQNLRPKVDYVEGEGEGGEEDEEGGGGFDQSLAHRGEHQRELPTWEMQYNQIIGYPIPQIHESCHNHNNQNTVFQCFITLIIAMSLNFKKTAATTNTDKL